MPCVLTAGVTIAVALALSGTRHFREGTSLRAVITSTPGSGHGPSAILLGRAVPTTKEGGLIRRLEQAGMATVFELELPEVGTGRGVVEILDQDQNGVVRAAGRWIEPEGGTFFVQKQGSPGGGGAVVGLVEWPDSERAFRWETSDEGSPGEWVARRLDEVRCVALPPPDPRQDDGWAGRSRTVHTAHREDEIPIQVDADGIALLESLPGPYPVIYLDFHGGSTTTWGGIEYGRADYENAEIREIWERVAEDFRPFRLNVVTDERAFSKAPANSRQRVIITPTDTAMPGAGGVAYAGSFNWTAETPCWVFVTNHVRYCAQAVSHEAGHTLGLSHAGQRTPSELTEYYRGHGTGETGWAPIMGLAYYRNVTQWSRGEYTNADNLQDQLRILVSQNNMAWRDDDTGDSGGDARQLEIHEDGAAGAMGLIERSGDVDAFVFTTDGGSLALTALPSALGPNLALAVELWSADGGRVAVGRDEDSLGASLTATLAPGSYTFRVIGSGRNDPLTDGFSDYGSLGVYSVTGRVAGARAPDRFMIPENAPEGSLVGMIVPRLSHSGAVQYSIAAGNSNRIFSLTLAGHLVVADNQRLDFEFLSAAPERPTEVELWVNIADAIDSSRSEFNRRVVVTVTDVAEPPTLNRFNRGGLAMGCFGATCTFSISVLEHTAPETILGTVLGADPDRGTLLSYALVEGNEDGLFRMDARSGQLFVTGDLVAARQNIYDLGVAVFDGTWPVSLSATSRVHVTVELPLERGGISFVIHTNIDGTLVSDLTSDPSFPQDPAWGGRFGSLEGNSQNSGVVDLIDFAWGEGGVPFWHQASTSAVVRVEWGTLGSSLAPAFFLPGILGDPWPGNATPGLGRFGAALRGYLLPPKSGEYTFWISGQNNCELWIGTSTNPATMARVASVAGGDAATGIREWTRYPSQKSEPIPLAAGHAYAVEVLVKAQDIGSHVAVAWESPGTGLAREVIPGRHLALRYLNYRPRAAGFSGWLRSDAITGHRLGRIQVTDVNREDTLRFRMTDGNEPGLFALDTVTGEIALADAGGLAALVGSRVSVAVEVLDDGMPPLSSLVTVELEVVATNAIVADGLFEELWTGLDDPVSVTRLMWNPRFPGRPDEVRAIQGFGTSDPGGPGRGNRGSRIRGLLTPAETGLHRLFIASDGEGQLKFSFGEDAEAVEMVAWTGGGAAPEEWNHAGSQGSGPLWLVAGTPYYIEALHAHHAGAGHVEVGWSEPGTVTAHAIPPWALAPVDIGYAPEIEDALATVSSSATNGALVAHLSAVDSAAESLVFGFVGGHDPGPFRLEPGTGDVLVSDAALLADLVGQTLRLPVQVQDSGYQGRVPLRSAVATLTLHVVDTTPASVWVGAGNDPNWSTGPNWAPSGPVDGVKLTFGGVTRRTNRNDVLQRVGLVRFNAGGFEITGNPLTLAGGLASHGDNTWDIACALSGPQGITNLSRTLTWTGRLNTQGHALTVRVDDLLRLEGELSGTGSLVKAGPGTLILGDRNTYSGPTTIQAGKVVLAGAGSLGVSPRVTLSGGVLDVQEVAPAFIVGTSQTLAGVGTAFGQVHIEGLLEPGLQTLLGALTFTGSLTLGGHTVIPIQRDRGFPGIPDIPGVIGVSGGITFTVLPALRVNGRLHCGGRLTLRSRETAPVYSVGDRFQVFNAESVSGSFDHVQLPELPTGLRWETGRLTTEGWIQVSVKPPELLPTSVANGLVAIRFRGGAGNRYFVETAESLLPEAVWTVLATRTGSGAVIVVHVPVATGEGARFFRVRAE